MTFTFLFGLHFEHIQPHPFSFSKFLKARGEQYLKISFYFSPPIILFIFILFFKIIFLLSFSQFLFSLLYYLLLNPSKLAFFKFYQIQKQTVLEDQSNYIYLSIYLSIYINTSTPSLKFPIFSNIISLYTHTFSIAINSQCNKHFNLTNIILIKEGKCYKPSLGRSIVYRKL